MIKRLIAADPAPGVRTVATGDPRLPASRAGVVGRIWTLMIAADFCIQVRRQFHRSQGVVVFDRHVTDAFVTLRALYCAAPNGLAERLIKAVLPGAYLQIHLDVPREVAVARKPGDTIGEWTVSRQLEEYEAIEMTHEGVLLLDGRLPVEDLTLAVLRRLTESESAKP